MSIRFHRYWNIFTVIGLLSSLWLIALPTAQAERPLQALEEPSRQTTLQDMLLSVSGERILKQIDALSKFSRCLTDPGHAQAGQYIINELKELGFEPVVQNFQSTAVRGGPRLQNIVVRWPGTNPQATHLAVAHWDSSPVRTFPPVCNSLAPGANDNASGAAALLEMARLLATGRAAFRDEVALVWFDAEEFGYLGSQHLVNSWNSDRQANPNALPFGTVINLDMVGYSGGKSQGEVWAVGNDAASVALTKEGASLVTQYLPGVRYNTYTIGERYPAFRDPNRNSDQRPFWDAGVGTAIFLTEDALDIIGADSRWHTPGDTTYLSDGKLRLDPSLLADSTRVALLITGSKAGIAPGRFFANIEAAFERNWSQADRPVRLASEGGPTTGRGWLWGPQPLLTRSEPYEQGPNGTRPVVYFDKARMELTDPASGRVTNGLLVTEMATGRLQLGDNRFEAVGTSNLQVAGDNNQKGDNDTAPTYASFRALVEAGPGAEASGGRLIATLDKSGGLGQNAALSQFATNRYYVTETGHNIPDVFWNWFSLTGRIYDPSSDQYRTGPVLDWLATVGLPITEAYWVRTKVSGVEKDVLVQLFQRRVLTYTPANAPEWRVEMGNVGQHYLAWRNP